MTKLSRLMGKSILATCLAGNVVVANAEVLVHEVHKGLMAEFSGFSSDGAYIRGGVAEHSDGANKQARFAYVIYKDQVVRSWVGNIPHSAVNGFGTGNLTVNLNICDINPSSACGPVKITWKANTEQSRFFSGIQRKKRYVILSKTVGTSSYNMANVSGSILGIDLSTASRVHARMGYNHKVTHTISLVNN